MRGGNKSETHLSPSHVTLSGFPIGWFIHTGKDTIKLSTEFCWLIVWEIFPMETEK